MISKRFNLDARRNRWGGAVLHPLHQLIVSGGQYIRRRNAGSDGLDATPRWRRRIQIGGFGRNAVIAKLERLAAIAQMLIDMRGPRDLPGPECSAIVLANVGLVESGDVEFGQHLEDGCRKVLTDSLADRRKQKESIEKVGQRMNRFRVD